MITRDGVVKVSSELNTETNEMEICSLKVDDIDIPLNIAAKEELEAMKAEVDKMKNTISFAFIAAGIGIVLAILSIVIGAVNNYQKKIEVPEFDDQRYTVEHNSSSIYSSFSTVTDNETGKKYLMVISPNGVDLTEME